MKLVSIHPHHGYLNTEFEIKSLSSTAITTSNVIGGKPLCLQAGESIKIKLDAGEHTIEFLSNGNSQIETINVEDAYRFGGSILRYAYLTPHSPHAVLVMLDRMYIYNYDTDEFWYENKLTPESVEEVFPNILLFKTNESRESEGQTITITHHSIFDIRKKCVILDFEEEVAHSSEYIIFKRLIDKNTLTIYNFEYDFLWELCVENYCIDKENDCLYFTKPSDIDNVYSFPYLSSFFRACIRNESDKAFVDINHESNVSFETIAYKMNAEQFEQFAGTHYLITDRNLVDLKENRTQTLTTDWGRLAQDNKQRCSIFEQLKQCVQTEEINKALRDNSNFCDGIFKRYTEIKPYPLHNGILWTEECCEATVNSKTCIYKVLHSLNPIKMPYGETYQLHLPNSSTIQKKNDKFIYIAFDNQKLYVSGDGSVTGNFDEEKEEKIVCMEKKTPGIKRASSFVNYINAYGRKCRFDVVIYQEGRNFNVGIWLNDQYVQKGKLSEKINSDSFNFAMFGSDNSGVLISHSYSKEFRWMDKDGLLHECCFDDTSFISEFISKGINGYKPLIKFDEYRRPVFVDPVTSSLIEPAYLSKYVFTSPDSSLYADNNHKKHIRYWDKEKREYIPKKLYDDFSEGLEYPSQGEISETKKKLIYNERVEYLNKLGINNIVTADILSSFPELESKTEEFTIDFLASKSSFSVVDLFIRKEQWIVIKQTNNETYREIYVGSPLWYLNYVSFSYDKKYVAISGRYPDGGNKGGLLYVYDLDLKKCVFDNTQENNMYNAVWIASFNKQGLIGSWSTGTYSNGAITRFYELKDGKYVKSQQLSNRNFLTFSASGNLIALSNQNYIPYKSGKNKHSWGHQPSCHVFIYDTKTNCEIGSYNDFGYYGIEGVGQYKESVASVSFSPDEKRYLAVSRDGVVVIRNLPDKELQK